MLGVCLFDMKFTYILAGWEGLAHDARVLSSVVGVREKNFPTPPPGMSIPILAIYVDKQASSLVA